MTNYKAIAKSAEKKPKTRISETSEPALSTQSTLDTSYLTPWLAPNPKLTSHNIHFLQRTIGNQAIGKIIQTRRKVSQPGDIHELEAERVAQQIMRMPEPQPVAEKNGGLIQTKAITRGTQEIDPTLQKSLDNMQGGGQPLPASTRAFFEPRLGHDFSQVRAHTDSRAVEATRTINARAFTTGQDIMFGAGQYAPETGTGRQLLAHELTHVVQQSSASSDAVSGKPKASSLIDRAITGSKPTPAVTKNIPEGKTPVPIASENIAPGVMELKGMGVFAPPAPIVSFLEQHQKAMVNVRFGKMAEGAIEVSKLPKGGYKAVKSAIPLRHPLFARIGEVMPELTPGLIVQVQGEKLEGYISVAAGAKIPENAALATHLQKAPELLGLLGFQIMALPKIINTIEGGKLHLGIKGVKINIGGAFSGAIDLEVIDEAITFNGNAQINVKGLANGDLALSRSEDGLITGKVALGLQLPKNFSGSAEVNWDGRAITGEAKAGYQGEKLSGEIILRLMEKEQAAQLEHEKKAPEKAAAVVPAAKAKSKKIEYVLFGEGDLTFSFTDWLNGAAHVIIDQKGFVTIIGKITPQKEFILFDQKDYVKQLFKVEARASYGIPIVGNIFIFANIGMDAFAKIGPAKFYNITVDGTYSTDPQKSKSFSIKGSLNLSAAAGLRLRGEAGAGLEVIAHDIKAGAGINAIAAIRAYAEATPTVGYREKAAPGEDKKGEFFIRGDLEIAAQPFLGLGGDLFVEIDAPWWSPVPDKKWTWPLVNKEWPLGGSFGLLASVDYVFGSKQLPSVEFKPVEFSADKFMTDLYQDKAKPKSGEAEEQKGQWTEKNTKDAEPPKGAEKTGNATPGKPAALPEAQAKVKPGGAKKPEKPVDPNARTAEGKSVKELQEEAAKKGKKPEGKEVAKGTGTDEKAGKDKAKDTHDEELRQGLGALQAVTDRYAKNGAKKEEVVTGVKAVRRKFKVFKSIEVVDGGETWDYHYFANEGIQRGPKKGQIQKVPTGLTKDDAIPIKWFKRLDLYVPYMELPRLGIKIDRDKPTSIPVGLEPDQKITIGVPNRYWPRIGKKMQYIPTERGNAVNQIRAVLDYYGFKRRELGVQMDHIQDLQFEGPDIPENVWPYDSSANMSAGPRQRDQKVTFLDEKSGMPNQAKTNELPGRWFVIIEIE